MMNIQNLGSQETIGVKYIDGIYAKFIWSSGLKATGAWVEMVLNAVQKQSFKQSLPTVSLEAAVCRCSSK